MAYERTPNEEQFLAEVASHEMTVLRDEEGFRHLRFQRPGTRVMGFDILTWPGHLCYTGDMGTYVFSRLPDMFEFFRGEPEGPLKPNPGYWSEKVLAQDRNGGVMEFEPEIFRKAIESWLDDHEASDEVRERVAAEVLPRAFDGEYAAMSAALDFEHEGFHLTDFYEARVRDFTHSFMWCCYALPWAVRQYDAMKAEPAEKPARARP